VTGKSARNIGNREETAALRFLEQEGLRLVTRNYCCPRGEIDLIMWDRECLVFIEVRYRKHGRFGSAAETVTAAKQERIISAAAHYLQSKRSGTEDVPCRLDVVALSAGERKKIEWIKNAFWLGT
jgi:putative endonuclease